MQSDNNSGIILSDEIKSWSSFGEILRSNDRELFFQMLNECKVYESGAAAKGVYFKYRKPINVNHFQSTKNDKGAA
jgi:hypothetical protein